MPPSPEIEERPGDVLSVAVIGNDTVLAALPAHPVQLAHGCHLLGYHTVVPASWGDELIADAVLREAEHRGRRPAIVCACERARARLTTGAGELLPFLISTIAPPVATARYLRALLPERRLDITFVGDCTSGVDPVFDARYSPDVFLVRLRSAGIDLQQLPTHFENVMPPDRRRHASLPGGCPTPEALARFCPERQLVELTDSNLAIELAQQLFAQDAVLLDIAPGVGCACAGVRATGSARTARVAVTSLEPPRSLEPVVDNAALIDVSATSLPPLTLSLLARDPNADAVQSVVPPTPVDRKEASQIATDTFDAPAPRRIATADSATAPNVIHPKRPFAITPPHALRGLAVAPRRIIGVEHNQRALHTSYGSVAVADDEAPMVRAVSFPSDSANLSALPLEMAPPLATSVETIRQHVIMEDSVGAAHRTAQTRIRAAARHVRPPRQELLRGVALWSTVILAAILCALLIVSRSR